MIRKMMACRLGIPGGTNLSKALALYEEAALRKDVEGMTNLAWMHARGLGTPHGRANATCALELYWEAVKLAPDSSHAAAPFLAYCWLSLVLAAGRGPAWSLSAGMKQDLVNIVVLLISLAAVLWLQRTRADVRAVRRHR
jgi:hypothetical protein